MFLLLLQNSSIGRFRGRIKDLHEIEHGHDFVEGEKTGVRHCFNIPDAV